jgi:hypothetical protein
MTSSRSCRPRRHPAREVTRRRCAPLPRSPCIIYTMRPADRHGGAIRICIAINAGADGVETTQATRAQRPRRRPLVLSDGAAG